MPTYSTTTKYALRTLQGSNLASDIDQGFADLGSDIDGNMAGYAQGTLASVPAAGKSGRLYRATDARAILMDTGSAWVDLVPQRVTSLPGTPYDGQVIHYVADATNGVIWPLRYNAGSVSAYKWEAVGAMPLIAEVLATETLAANASYADLTTVGPSITVPLAGDYAIAPSAELSSTSSGATFAAAVAAVKFGAAAASDNDALEMVGGLISGTGSWNGTITCARSMRRNISAASQVVKMVYRSNGVVNMSAGKRCLSITPFRVG